MSTGVAGLQPGSGLADGDGAILRAVENVIRAAEEEQAHVAPVGTKPGHLLELPEVREVGLQAEVREEQLYLPVEQRAQVVGELPLLGPLPREHRALGGGARGDLGGSGVDRQRLARLEEALEALQRLALGEVLEP